jgi:HSP90 family molecular chaperone
MKENEDVFFDENKLMNIVKMHSEFINYDIELKSGEDWVVVNIGVPLWVRRSNEISEE